MKTKYLVFIFLAVVIATFILLLKLGLKQPIGNDGLKSQTTFAPFEIATSTEDFKNWKTLIYDKYNFEFKYPEFDFLSSHGSGRNSKMEYDSVNFHNFGVLFSANPNRLSLQDWFKMFANEYGDLNNLELRSLNNFEVMLPTKPFPQERLGALAATMAPTKDFVVMIMISESNQLNNPDLDKYGFSGFDGRIRFIKLILSTFKFNVPQTSTSDLKAYNSESGFEFKYPKSWNFKKSISEEKMEEIYLTAPDDEGESTKVTIGRLKIKRHDYFNIKEQIKRISALNSWDIYITEENGAQSYHATLPNYDAYFPDYAGFHIFSRNIPESTKVIDGILSTFKITK